VTRGPPAAPGELAPCAAFLFPALARLLRREPRHARRLVGGPAPSFSPAGLGLIWR
jgi:hypothetical protein